MKKVLPWMLGAVAVGGLFWFIKSKSGPTFQGGGFVNTGTSQPYDFLNPFRTNAQKNGVRLSGAQKELANVAAYAQAAPQVIKGVTDLFGSIGGIFKPKSTTTLSGLNAVDYKPYSITKADAYFYA